VTSCSDGVGLGEMTRGVEGTPDFWRSDMVVSEKGGRTGQRMAPTIMRRRHSKPDGQRREPAPRCLSRREVRREDGGDGDVDNDVVVDDDEDGYDDGGLLGGPKSEKRSWLCRVAGLGNGVVLEPIESRAMMCGAAEEDVSSTA
jgi:hypothetical protein